MNSRILAIRSETSMYWEPRFHFYAIELNPTLALIDQSLKVSHNEISRGFYTHFKEQ